MSEWTNYLSMRFWSKAAELQLSQNRKAHKKAAQGIERLWII